MAVLYAFRDRGGRRRATVRMDNGEAVQIAVRTSGVAVRWSRFGFLGSKLYHAHSLRDAAATANRLERICNGHLTPPGMDDPLLRIFTKAVLQCSTVTQVTELLNGDAEPVDVGGLAVTAPTGSEGVA